MTEKMEEVNNDLKMLDKNSKNSKRKKKKMKEMKEMKEIRKANSIQQNPIQLNASYQSEQINQNRTEQSRAEQSRTEQNKQHRAHQHTPSACAAASVLSVPSPRRAWRCAHTHRKRARRCVDRRRHEVPKW